MFKPVPGEYNFPKSEMEVLAFWKEHGIFEKSISLREGCKPYVFYEGPPTANGKPGIHHVLARSFKDLFPRYRTMTGRKVERKAGWDTHGLPVEIEIEKELGLSSKEQIEEYGVERFVRKCRASVFRYTREWEKLTDRIGFWIDMSDPYVTCSTEYTQSVWWALAKMYKQGLLYRGHKILPWCPRCGTALSSHEVGWGYKTVKDPSVVVRFKVEGAKDTFFLAWTTTPWTLISNAALTVAPDREYAYVRRGAETLILARELVEQVLGSRETEGEAGYEIVKTVPGKELLRTKYEPLFSYAPFKGEAHFVITGDFVTLETGTGIVHTATAFGADDYNAGKEFGLPVICPVKPDGRFDACVVPWAGEFVRDADKDIIRDLKDRGLLFSRDEIEHEYPFCWRCDSPLLYFPREAWFIRTTDFVDRLLANNDKIGWMPDHVRTGRFGNFLRDNVDWALSRERYWGTPLPIWQCEKCGFQEAIASKAELVERNRDAFAGFERRRSEDSTLEEDLAVHRPFIDEVKYPCPECDAVMKRVPEVIDCWFDSGSMPFAQWGYPYCERKKFEEAFPCDFISEAIDQTRGWFYTLLAISTILFDDTSFRNCLVLGHICDERGEKMSKSRGNVVKPEEILDHQGADALRWTFYSANQPWSSVRFSARAVKMAQKDFLVKLREVYRFFVIYGNIDRFDPSEGNSDGGEKTPAAATFASSSSYTDPRERSLLDRWILAELARTTRIVRERMDTYDVHPAAKALGAFVDSLSNWYVRTSRDRFWKPGTDRDKLDAYWTLYECLIASARLLAPFTPFFAEEMYLNLVSSVWQGMPESVHLCDYPEADEYTVDEGLISEMGMVREVVSLGRSARAAEHIRVRQPLKEAIVALADSSVASAVESHSELIAGELNVKKIRFVADPDQYVHYEIKPNFRLVGPRLGKKAQQAKAALASLDAREAVARLRAGKKISAVIGGEAVDFSPEEVEVSLRAKEHYTAAESGGAVVVLDIEITPELRDEGFARDLVSAVQAVRKEMDLPYEARINLWVAGGEEVARVVEEFNDYIAHETLSTCTLGSSDEAEHRKSVSVLGEQVELCVGRRKAEGLP